MSETFERFLSVAMLVAGVGLIAQGYALHHESFTGYLMVALGAAALGVHHGISWGARA